jgi:hypothetical protein
MLKEYIAPIFNPQLFEGLNIQEIQDLIKAKLSDKISFVSSLVKKEYQLNDPFDALYLSYFGSSAKTYRCVAIYENPKMDLYIFMEKIS